MLKKQKGSALLSALLIMSLVAIVSIAMMNRLNRDIQSSLTIARSDRLQWAAQALQFWAMEGLKNPQSKLIKRDNQAKVLTSPKSLDHIAVPVQLKGELYDLQAKFNINNLYNKDYQSIFMALLKKLNLGGNPYQRQQMMEAILYWLQAKADTSNQEAWTQRYARLNPPYGPSHLPLSHPSELRLVIGLSAQSYQRLEPYVTALSQSTTININTASLKLIGALAPGITNKDLQQINQRRHEKPYQDLNELKKFLSRYHIPAAVLSTESQYFMLLSSAKESDLSIQTYTHLMRTKSKQGQWHVAIISQSINTF